MAIEEGKAAPLFTLKDADGNKVALKDLKGKHVVVYFYPKDDTPGCTKEACGFRDNWGDIEKIGAVVLGVSPDSEESHQKFRDKYDLPFTLLCDPDRKVMTKYGAYGEKMMYGKKVMGVIRSHGADRPERQGGQALAPSLPRRRPSDQGARGPLRRVGYLGTKSRFREQLEGGRLALHAPARARSQGPLRKLLGRRATLSRGR